MAHSLSVFATAEQFSGPLRVEIDQDSEKIIAHRITMREVEVQGKIMAPKTLLQMFDMDFNDHAVSKVPDKRRLSQDDRKFLNMVAKETKVVNGHYQTPLPFRHNDVIMPNNKEQAARRANWQKKKMLKDPKYRSDYVTFVNDVTAKGYARKVPSGSLMPRPGKVW